MNEGGSGWLAALVITSGLFLPGCGGDTVPGPLGTEGAHEHGVVRVNVAVDGNEAEVEFFSPAMNIYGFEYAPATDEDRARQQEGLTTLRERFAEMLVLDPALGCTVEPVIVGMMAGDHDHDHDHADEHQDDHAHEDDHDHGHDDEHGHDHDQEAVDDHDHSNGHADVYGEFRVVCQQPLTGSRVRLAFGEVFPAVENVDLQVVGDRSIGGRYPATGSRVQF